MTIQNEQNTQKLNMKNIESKVLEMYNDCDDAEYDEQDEYFYDVDDNNNDGRRRPFYCGFLTLRKHGVCHFGFILKSRAREIL
jgi:hypothetical protein